MFENQIFKEMESSLFSSLILSTKPNKRLSQIRIKQVKMSVNTAVKELCFSNFALSRISPGHEKPSDQVTGRSQEIFHSWYLAESFQDMSRSNKSSLSRFVSSTIHILVL